MRIHAFYNYLAEEKVITENIACKVKMQKEDIKIDEFTDEQIKQMLAYRGAGRKEHSYFSYRGYFLIIMLVLTGIRRN